MPKKLQCNYFNKYSQTAQNCNKTKILKNRYICQKFGKRLIQF